MVFRQVRPDLEKYPAGYCSKRFFPRLGSVMRIIPRPCRHVIQCEKLTKCLFAEYPLRFLMNGILHEKFKMPS